MNITAKLEQLEAKYNLSGLSKKASQVTNEYITYEEGTDTGVDYVDINDDFVSISEIIESYGGALEISTIIRGNTASLAYVNDDREIKHAMFVLAEGVWS